MFMDDFYQRWYKLSTAFLRGGGLPVWKIWLVMYGYVWLCIVMYCYVWFLGKNSRGGWVREWLAGNCIHVNSSVHGFSGEYQSVDSSTYGVGGWVAGSGKSRLHSPNELLFDSRSLVCFKKTLACPSKV
jgi:hypothetical protein